MTKIALLGASGRMGLTVIRAVHQAEGLELVSALVGADSRHRGRDAGDLAGLGPIGVALGDELGQPDVLIDFSAPRALQEWAARCAGAGVAVVSGTTGLNEADRMALDRAADKVPVLWAPNLSIGIQILYVLAAKTAAAVGSSADIEISETHHRFKRDAPSGTALELGRVINRAMQRDEESGWIRGRDGGDCRRKPGEIGFSARRAGEVIGDHTVLFGLQGERLELSHSAGSRDAFVHGALLAARWIPTRAPGRYVFADVLGLGP